MHKLEISLETCNNCKELFLTHLKLEAFNNSKTSLSHSSNFKVETFKKLEEHFSPFENLQHFEEVSSTLPTHLEMLQAPCMPLLGNGLPLTLQPCK
jgi:hypothetical protein